MLSNSSQNQHSNIQHQPKNDKSNKQKLQKNKTTKIQSKSLSKQIQKYTANDNLIQKQNDQYDDVLKMSGVLQAYQQFLKTLCKYGLPTGNIYQFAAQQIQKFQRKKKAKSLKIKAQMEILKAAKKKQQRQKQKQHKQSNKL